MTEVRPSRKRRERSRSAAARPFYMLLLVAAGVVVAGAMAFYKAHPFGGADERELIATGQGCVRAAIAEQLKTSFGGSSATHIEHLADGKFLITGWVDIHAENGSVDRQNYSCEVYRTSAGKWAGEKVMIVPPKS